MIYSENDKINLISHWISSCCFIVCLVLSERCSPCSWSSVQLPDEFISPFPNLLIFLGNSVSFDPIFTLKSKLLLSQPMRLAGLLLQFVDRIILSFRGFFFFLLRVFVGTYADFATKLLCFIFIVVVDTLLDIFMRIGFSF